MSTPGERAEDVNAFMLFMDDLQQSDLVKYGLTITTADKIFPITPPFSLSVLLAVVEELKDAKLARAKLELKSVDS